MDETDVGCFGILLIVILIGAVLVTWACTSQSWKNDAVAKGAAEYYTGAKGNCEWRWIVDRPKAEETKP